MGAWLYSTEPYLISAAFMLMIIVKLRFGPFKPQLYRVLMRLSVSLIVYFIVLSFYDLLGPHTNMMRPFVFYVRAFCYYSPLYVIGYYWLIYAAHLMEETWLQSRRMQVLLAIPMLVAWLFLATSYLTGYTGFIVRTFPRFGCLAELAFWITPALYMFFGALLGVRHGRRSPETRGVDYAYAVFSVLPNVFGMLQSFFPHAQLFPLVCFSSVAGVGFAYVSALDALISRDPLTRLNNRHEFMLHLHRVIKQRRPSMQQYLIMIDADKFKTVNDRFGHAEGDRALVMIATALRQVGAQHATHAFIARYGGDEFAMVVAAESEQDVRELCEKIKQHVKYIAKARKLPYVLSVSTGFSVLRAGRPLKESFVQADANMYCDKTAPPWATAKI